MWAQRCLQIKRGADLTSGKWENFFADIEGFDYEAGYLYRLRVKKSARPKPIPVDVGGTIYTLVEIMEKRPDTKLRLNDIWALERIGIEDVDATDFGVSIQHPTIEFQLADKRVMGTNGCNSFNGELLEVGDHSISIGPLAMTRKACMGSRIPDRVTGALDKVTGYQLDGLKLSLLDADGAEILRYRKVD